jgi:hypothetical protein
MVRFDSLTGCAEVWIDGAQVAGKPTPDPGPLQVPFNPGAKTRTLTVRIVVAGGRTSAGITGPVTVLPAASVATP